MCKPQIASTYYLRGPVKCLRLARGHKAHTDRGGIRTVFFWFKLNLFSALVLNTEYPYVCLTRVTPCCGSVEELLRQVVAYPSIHKLHPSLQDVVHPQHHRAWIGLEVRALRNVCRKNHGSNPQKHQSKPALKGHVNVSSLIMEKTGPRIPATIC